MEAVGFWPRGKRAMRTSAFRVRHAQRGGFYSSRVNLAAFLFFRLRSIRDSVAALRRVVSGWSPIRPLLLRNVRVGGQPPFWESSPIPPSAMIGAKGLFEEGAHLSEVRRH